MDELVAILDEDNRVIGTAPRSVMRRDNLRHAATGVVVRNAAGDVYVHRRTPIKDVYPGRYDFAAGGVVAAGEDPYDAVVRELAEELGISGVELTELPEGDYADDHTTYHAYLYTCVWDGPVRHQPEEVEWGAWMTPTDLVAKLDEWPFMPDTVGLLGSYVRDLTINEGWDSIAWYDGPWIHRVPRRPAVQALLQAETTLLPWLAPQLPLPIPVPEPTENGVRHLALRGSPLEAGDRSIGRQLGAFLSALHAVDPSEAAIRGARDATRAGDEKAVFLAECRAQVVPLLPADKQTAAQELLDRIPGHRTALVHCDLGPDHILVHAGQVTGIIDWTDAEIGDPAVDLCWILNDAGPELAAGVAETYDVTPELRARARDWASLGPWYGVHRGLLLDLPDDVENGLQEILNSL
ncbi:phosphotransferase [Kribbella sp. NPDC055071]